MKAEKLKELILKSLEGDTPDAEILKQIETAGVSYSFSEDFTEKVLDKVFAPAKVITRETEFLFSFRRVFYKIAFTGVAAIIILLISIYISQGTLSVDSFLGLGDGVDESILCVLTGN